MAAPSHLSLPKFGPFFRVSSTSQSDDQAHAIEKSGELWGEPPPWSNLLQVKAYVGKLPDDAIGIEFWTDVAPHPNTAPHKAHWYEGDPGVRVDGQYAKIDVVVTKNTHPRPEL